MSTAFASSKNAINFFHIYYNQFLLLKSLSRLLQEDLLQKLVSQIAQSYGLQYFLLNIQLIDIFFKLTERRQNIDFFGLTSSRFRGTVNYL